MTVFKAIIQLSMGIIASFCLFRKMEDGGGGMIVERWRGLNYFAVKDLLTV